MLFYAPDHGIELSCVLGRKAVMPFDEWAFAVRGAEDLELWPLHADECSIFATQGQCDSFVYAAIVVGTETTILPEQVCKSKNLVLLILGSKELFVGIPPSLGDGTVELAHRDERKVVRHADFLHAKRLCYSVIITNV